MNPSQIIISIDPALLKKVDQLIRSNLFVDRSQALQAALEEKISRLEKTRLAQECAKLDPAEERALAEEGWADESHQWPEY